MSENNWGRIVWRRFAWRIGIGAVRKEKLNEFEIPIKDSIVNWARHSYVEIWICAIGKKDATNIKPTTANCSHTRCISRSGYRFECHKSKRDCKEKR